MSKTKRHYHPITRVLMAMTCLAIAFPVGSFVLLGLSYSSRPAVADDSRPVVVERHRDKADRNRGGGLSPLGGRLGGGTLSGLGWLGGQLRVESKVAKAVREIQASADDDESKTKQTEKLRELLNQEFAKMHDKQAEEIAKTQERLNKLKKTHQSRGDNQDKIVQRRIDQLLGKPDDLVWIEDDRSTPSRRSGLGRSRSSRLVPKSRRPSASFSMRGSSNGGSLMPGGSVDTSSLSEIFQLAREAGNAINSFKIAKDDFGQMMQSRGSKSSPIVLSEIRQAKSNLEKMRLIERSYRQQIEAVNRRLEQAVKHAKESLERAEDILRMIDRHFKTGEATVDKVLKAKLEVSRLEHELEDTTLELQQLRDATAVFEKSVEDEKDKKDDKQAKVKGDPLAADDDPFAQ